MGADLQSLHCGHHTNIQVLVTTYLIASTHSIAGMSGYCTDSLSVYNVDYQLEDIER